ncbi:MAG: hypothetical protein WBJ51_04740 [Methanoculleus sp.]
MTPVLACPLVVPPIGFRTGVAIHSPPALEDDTAAAAPGGWDLSDK